MRTSAGTRGSPISHLMDVFADADPLLRELGVHFESNAGEAAAGATRAASVNYSLRGAVTWKSVVGTYVASDALSNIASGGVRGGGWIVGGEDYGEGSSIMQAKRSVDPLEPVAVRLAGRQDYATKKGPLEICSLEVKSRPGGRLAWLGDQLEARSPAV